MSFCRVASFDDLWSGEMTSVRTGGRSVLLINVDGAVSAYEDRCRHQGVPLVSGNLMGHVLTCAVHAWQYDVRTGKGMNPCNVSLHRYPVKVLGGDIWVDVEEGGAADDDGK